MEPSADLPADAKNEFEIINTYFVPLAGPEGLDLIDDAACFRAPDGSDVIVTKDVLVAGVHFLENDKAEDIAFKALSVNVSDLAAKGARPKFYLLGLCLPENLVVSSWLKSFVQGLANAQLEYGLKLIGGDTTKTTGPLTISITAIGYVQQGQMIRRSGAKVGDDIYVSGTIGDPGLALKMIRGELNLCAEVLDRFHRPLARPVLGQGLVNEASAAIDVSDGLIADISHLCEASGVGAEIKKDNIPLSLAGRGVVENDLSLWPIIWAGGDDYEIAFTAPPEKGPKIAEIAAETGIEVSRIGVIISGDSVEIVDCTGKLVQVGRSGYKHF